MSASLMELKTVETCTGALDYRCGGSVMDFNLKEIKQQIWLPQNKFVHSHHNNK